MILFRVFRSGKPLFSWNNSESIGENPIIAKSKPIGSNYLGFKIINVYFESNHVGPLPKVAYIIVLTCVNVPLLEIVLASDTN
jgi:hypothetical protein